MSSLSPFSQRPEWRQNHVQHVLGVCQCHIVQFQGVPITLYLWQDWASSGLWFLYDQLAKNRAHIFKELLKRRKGVCDIICGPQSFKMYRPWLSRKSFEYPVWWLPCTWRVLPGIGQHNGFASCQGMRSWPNSVQGSQPRPRMHRLFGRPITSPLWFSYLSGHSSLWLSFHSPLICWEFSP